MTTLDPEALANLDEEFLAELTDEELDILLLELEEAWAAPGEPDLQVHQLPPDPWDFAWLFEAGRGAGKTYALGHHFYRHMTGPPCDPRIPGGHRGAIIAPTLGDVTTSCYEGPSGLLQIDPRLNMVTRKGGTFVDFPNGAVAKVQGAETRKEAKRLRAHGNTCCIWVEELGAIGALYALWQQILLSCRLGPHPRVMMSTTPVQRAPYKVIRQSANVSITNASLLENVHAEPRFKERALAAFDGVTAQLEVHGIYVDEKPGALYTSQVIDSRRINEEDLRAKHPMGSETREEWLRRVLKLTTIYVGVDPATSGRGDRTGIIVVGADSPRAHPDGLRHIYILEDLTGMMVPSIIDMGESPGDEDLDEDIESWADVAVEAAIRWEANAIRVERNRLGRTARATIRASHYQGAILDYDSKDSKANRHDHLRAAWRRRCWLVGTAPQLEAEMTTWVPAEGDAPEPLLDRPEDVAEDDFTGSPDAMDGYAAAANPLLGLHRRPKQGHGPLTGVMEEGWVAGGFPQ